MTLMELCRSYKGQWVALNDVVYGEDFDPVSGSLVDYDPDLPTLCHRMTKNKNSSCHVYFCDPRRYSDILH